MGDTDGTIKYDLELGTGKAIQQMDAWDQAVKRSQDLLERGMDDPTEKLEAGLRRAAESHEKAGEAAEEHVGHLRHLSHSFDLLSESMGAESVMNRQATSGLMILGSAMGGVGGAVAVLIPAVVTAISAFYDMATGEQAAKEQAKAMTEEMEKLDGVLQSLSEGMEHTSQLKLTAGFDALARDGQKIDAEIAKVKALEDAQRNLHKVQDEAEISRLRTQENIKLSHAGNEFEQAHIKLDTAQKIAEIENLSARRDADAAVTAAQTQQSLAQQKLDSNKKAIADELEGIAKVEKDKRAALDLASKSPNHPIKSDQAYALDKLAELEGKSRELAKNAKAYIDPMHAAAAGLVAGGPMGPIVAAQAYIGAAATNKPTQLSPAEQDMLTELKRSRAEIDQAQREGRVTYGESKTKRSDPVEQGTAEHIGTSLKIAQRELEAHAEELKKHKGATAAVTQELTNAAASTKQREAEAEKISQQAKERDADLSRQKIDLQNKEAQRKDQDAEAAKRNNRENSYKAAEENQRKAKEKLRAEMSAFDEAFKTQTAHMERQSAQHSDAMKIHGYQKPSEVSGLNWLGAHGPQRKPGAQGPGSESGLDWLHAHGPAGKVEAITSQLEDMIKRPWTQTPAGKMMDNILKNAMPKEDPNSPEAMIHKMFTPEMIDASKKPTEQGRFIKEQLEHAQKTMAQYNAHGKAVTKDLGTDSQGHKVVARVFDKMAKQREANDPDKNIKEMATAFKQLSEMLNNKLGVF